jgi:hypothetical protein
MGNGRLVSFSTITAKSSRSSINSRKSEMERTTAFLLPSLSVMNSGFNSFISIMFFHFFYGFFYGVFLKFKSKYTMFLFFSICIELDDLDFSFTAHQKLFVTIIALHRYLLNLSLMCQRKK